MNKSFESLLLEALSPDQKNHIDDLKGAIDGEIQSTKQIRTIFPELQKDDIKFLGHEQHNDVFEKHTGDSKAERLISPIGHDAKVDPHPKVRTWLESNGFSTDKYSEKTTSRMETSSKGDIRERTYRIGALLQKHAPKHIMKAYETDPAIASSKDEHQMVVTRNAYDIGGMTSGRHWVCTSCMRLPGEDASFPEKLKSAAAKGGYDYEGYIRNGGAYHDKIKGDFRHGSLVGYFTKKGDDTAENPVARTLFKKLEGTNKDGETHVVFRPEDSMYGDKSSKFIEHAKKFAEDTWPAKSGFKYEIPNELYNDSGMSFTHHADGETTHPNGVTANYKNGVLHSPDNNTPSVKYGGAYSSTEEFHKEGKYHREGDLPAAITKNTKGEVENEEYYKNNERHRDGDKPALINKSGNYLEHTYYKHGLIHRDGDAPSHILFDGEQNKPIVERYHKFGVPHRDNGLPSVIEHSSGNEEYHVHGERHRDGDLPAVITHRKGWMNNVSKEWYKNGILSREDGKPSKTLESPKDDGFSLEEHFTKNNGRPGSDKGDNYPHLTKTQVSNRYTKIEHNFTDGGELHIEKAEDKEHPLDSITYTNNRNAHIIVGHDHITNKTEIHHSYADENYNIKRNIYTIDHDKETVNHKESYNNEGNTHDLKKLPDEHKSNINHIMDSVNEHVGFKDEIKKKIFGDKK